MSPVEHTNLDEKVAGDDSSILTDPVLEKRVWRKLDIRFLPVVTMFYLLSFLDRTNIGNVRVAGLQTDLKMIDSQYSMALTATYIPYIAAELPSNLLLRAVGPNLMLPAMLTIWGIITTLQGLVTSYRGLLVARFFLGLFEGGVFPGLVLYLSLFYPRAKMNTRISAFFSAASLSGAFSGILAYAILKIQESSTQTRPGWAWVFITEGLFTVLFGLSGFFLLPRSPMTTWFFSQVEKEYVVRVLQEDGNITDNDSFSWKEVKAAFKLPQVWMIAVILFFNGAVLYGLAYFTPSIIVGLGYTASRAQLMSIPPYAAAFVVATVVAFISDRYRRRGLATILTGLLCTIGFGMFIGSNSASVQYGSLFLTIPGTYAMAPVTSTWCSNNAAPYTRRATAIAIAFIVTNLGGIFSTWLFGSISRAPRYQSATVVVLAFSVGIVVVGALNWAYLARENAKKLEVRMSTSRKNEDTGLGDRSAWFEYLV